MPAQVTSAFRRFGNALREFTIAQRTVALIGVAVLVLGIAALSMWATKPAFTPLFSGLSGSDANTIVDQLRTDGVPYELSDGGATILVPEKSVYDERLKAASAGLPSSSTGGYALLDKMGVTASEFQQSVTYKRALEGELAATIEALDGVRTASVRLAIPKESVFVAEANDPTASVFIETENGITLTGEQVEAIVHLTSSSIDGMAPSDVAVVDAGGAVLSAVGVGATGSADKQSSVYEERVQGSVQAMLDKIVGPGNASVVVAADLSYESAERVEETFTTPTDAPALNEAVKSETYAGSKGGAAGVLGPDNISVPAGADSDGTFTSKDSTRNNAVNKVTESRTIPSGAIKRQTVSVAVNSEAAGDLNVSDLSSLVASAAGIDLARGDEVTVEVVSFNTAGEQDAAAALAAAEAAENADRVAGLIRIAIIAAALVIPFILGLIVYARRSRRQSREPMDVGDLSEFRSALDAPTVPLVRAPSITPRIINPGPSIAYEATDAENLRSEIDALAQRDPKGTAQYLRGFMDERQPA
ncbi:flagellar M-ring protein FliF [Cryobacterium psychrotolerans]|uniref:Flagellar M-ring protein n=1 Tax=Cryobacterium psychrotolerans TaxID=386301 RepID=A0A1G8YAL1_9MICO|nr:MULTISPECIES: flagellar basal-body MS-ring/collar protein FliF [Cryobacterium]TFD49310.1 flagellar M-ring protein FliF [Cryobacterium sp. TMT1-2-1]TFD90922.1 flagellar M-ring protein FliF [Cryobacterium psychrotolerans]SDJ99929.1 flagellar M-ring protein FliF [Cryobacterium psychrotolerans]